MGKGIFGATTIIPDSIGWANCKATISMTLKHGKCEKYSLNGRYTHSHLKHTISQHPTTDVTFHVFCIAPFVPPARSVWVMKAWPTFKTRRPTKNPQSWLIEVFQWRIFILPSMKLAPKNGGGIGGIQSHCQPGFSWNVCGWAITVDICRYLILPSMVCLKLSEGCGLRWHEHWHLGSVYFQKNLKKINISVFSCWCFAGVFWKSHCRTFSVETRNMCWKPMKINMEPKTTQLKFGTSSSKLPFLDSVLVFGESRWTMCMAILGVELRGPHQDRLGVIRFYTLED